MMARILVIIGITITEGDINMILVLNAVTKRNYGALNDNCEIVEHRKFTDGFNITDLIIDDKLKRELERMRCNTVKNILFLDKVTGGTCMIQLLFEKI